MSTERDGSVAEILRGGPGRTSAPARHPWPAGTYLQGGSRGVVLAGSDTYTTAFVEAFPSEPPVFIRGEGDGIVAAEDAAWAKYRRMVDCPGHPEHGPWDRRKHLNGYAWCEQCGTGFGPGTTGLADITPKDAPPSALERALLGDPTEVIGAMADALGAEKTGNPLSDALAVNDALEALDV